MQTSQCWRLWDPLESFVSIMGRPHGLCTTDEAVPGFLVCTQDSQWLVHHEGTSLFVLLTCHWMGWFFLVKAALCSGLHTTNVFYHNCGNQRKGPASWLCGACCQAWGLSLIPKFCGVENENWPCKSSDNQMGTMAHTYMYVHIHVYKHKYTNNKCSFKGKKTFLDPVKYPRGWGWGNITPAWKPLSLSKVIIIPHDQY